MTETLDPIDVALLVTRAFDALGIQHTIGGSIASSIAGEPRSTLDIDIVAAVEPHHVAPLTGTLGESFYVDADAMARAVDDRRSVNLIHHDSQLKVDVFVAGGTPIDHLQLSRRREVDVGGRRIFVHPPEDILLQKLKWFRAGGERSDRQWRDVMGIVRVQGSRLDRTYLEAQAEVLRVSDLLERALASSPPDSD